MSTATTLGALAVAGRTVAHYASGHDVPAELAPRPFLHPVTTLAGATVTDAQPDDHRWHLGVSMAVQDVDGSNLWGGRTYVRDHGYTWRDDHGTMQHDAWLRQDRDVLAHHLTWHAHDATALVAETRTLRAAPLPADRGWTLDWSSALTPAGDHPVVLGSPGTNGRERAGYGGFFWRLPPSSSLQVRTPDGDGEDEVHGHPAAWLACTGVTAGRPYTLVFAAGDARTAGDPWFVRVAGYPGVGSALAFARVLTLEPGTTTRVRVRTHVLDDRLDRAGVAALFDATGRAPTGGADLHS